MRLTCVPAACLAAGFSLFGLAPAAPAQEANREVVVVKTDLGDIVRNLSRKTGEFKDSFNKAVEHAMMDGPKVEERARHRGDDLHASAKKLEDVYHDKKDKNNPAVREQVDKTLAAASEVNAVMRDHRFTDLLQREWESLRSDCNALAAVYELSPIR